MKFGMARNPSRLYDYVSGNFIPSMTIRAGYAAASSERGSEPSIRRLPVPSLDSTISKFLKSVKPLLSESDYNITRQVAITFAENEGKTLQRLLEERARNKENWLEDWWLRTAYLEYRDPVALFSSPALVWPSEPFNDERERLQYTSALISSALAFNEILDRKLIPQEKAGNELLDMSQYYKVFGTTRIPLATRDTLEYQDAKSPSSNIIVMSNNHAFSLTVLDSNRKILPVGSIYSMLEEVIKESKTPGLPVGVLTSDQRDRWARAYTLLCRTSGNLKSLEEIEKALFVVCLDQPLSPAPPRNRLTHVSRLLLHGSGFSRGNAANRWYDKTIQFIVGSGADGVGITYEHSPAEGNPIGVLADFILDRLKNFQSVSPAEIYLKPKKLRFESHGSIDKAIQEAGANIDKLAEDLDEFTFSFNGFGKNKLKSLKTSPDSFIQIAIQYAFYKVHKKPAAQYESGTLRKFVGGRTDVIRTCSEEALAFCQSNGSDRLNALLGALAAHKKYVNDAISFNAIDRHLLGLKLISKENGLPVPSLFSDNGYVASTYFQLSTSNVPTKNDAVMVYAPLVADGYACCYNPRDDNINFGTSAWKKSPITDITKFQAALVEALNEMKDILEASLNLNKQSKL